MKTKTYDLNLYVVDGEVMVLAHQLTKQNGNITTDGNKFTQILSILATRKNANVWRQVLTYFDELDLYDELDAWAFASVEDASTPSYKYTIDELAKMPKVLRDALILQPEYEVR